MLRILHKFEAFLLIALLSTLTLFMCTEALMRAFGIGALWLGEAIKWNTAWFVLFGISYGVRVNAHIGLTILTDNLRSRRLKKGFGLLAVAICLVYSTIFLSSGYQYVKTQKIFALPMEDLPFAQWIPYSGLLIGFLLLFIRFFVLGIKILRNRHDGFDFLDEAQESVKNLAQTATQE